MIEIKDLSLTFKNADEDHEALKAVTLDIPGSTAPTAVASPLTKQRSMTGRRLRRTSSL